MSNQLISFHDAFQQAAICQSPPVETPEFDLIPINTAEDIPGMLRRLVSREYDKFIGTVISWASNKYPDDALRLYAIADKEGRIYSAAVTNEYFEVKYGWTDTTGTAVEELHAKAITALEALRDERAIVKELEM